MRLSLILSASLFSMATFAAHENITSYNQLADALKKGCNVKVSVNYDNCTLQTKMPNPAKGASTTFSFNTFSNYKMQENNQSRAVYSFPINVYTENQDNSLVLAFGRLRVFDDNAVEVHTSLYNPENHQLKTSYNFTCHLGKDKNSIAIFAD